MNTEETGQILQQFGLNPVDFEIKTFGSGHINHTYLVTCFDRSKSYILQKINTFVFKNPEIIAKNISIASRYLKFKEPNYTFIEIFPTTSGQLLAIANEEYWRLSAFIDDSYSINTLDQPQQAYNASAAFGKLTHLLDGLSVEGLGYSIPDFHNLSWRFEQFEASLSSGNKKRISTSEEIIAYCLRNQNLVDIYKQIENNPEYPTRLIHHDTKINNVLFSKTTRESLAVCDLDTLMPGKIFSDVGDMVRTYTSDQSEESTDFEKVTIRLDFLKALFEGYMSELKNTLTIAEKNSLFYAGPILIYMQGLRFLTDYFNDDVYYPIHYKEHNLMRAMNQKALFEDYFNKEKEIRNILENLLKQ